MVARRIRVGTPASGSWQSVYTWDTAAFATDNDWNGYTVVCIVPITDFSATGGTRIRLTFNGEATQGFIASAMYIGNGGGGDVYDFGDTPVQMLMSGGATITVGAGAVGVVTDDVAFVKDAINPFVMAMQFQNSAHDNLIRNASGQDEDSYFKSATDAATQNKTGYSHNQTSSYIAKIELFR